MPRWLTSASTAALFSHHLLAALVHLLLRATTLADHSDTAWTILHSRDQSAFIGFFVNEIAVVLALLVVRGVGAGIRFVNAGKPSVTDRLMQLAAYGWAVVLGALDVAILALDERRYMDLGSGFLNTASEVANLRMAGGAAHPDCHARHPAHIFHYAVAKVHTCHDPDQVGGKIQDGEPTEMSVHLAELPAPRLRLELSQQQQAMAPLTAVRHGAHGLVIQTVARCRISTRRE